MKIIGTTTLFTLFLMMSHGVYAEPSTGNWEYKAKTIMLLKDDNVTNSINAMAKKNWELVDCTKKSGGQILCIFKKPKIQ